MLRPTSRKVLSVLQEAARTCWTRECRERHYRAVFSSLTCIFLCIYRQIIFRRVFSQGEKKNRVQRSPHPFSARLQMDGSRKQGRLLTNQITDRVSGNMMAVGLDHTTSYAVTPYDPASDHCVCVSQRLLTAC